MLTLTWKQKNAAMWTMSEQIDMGSNRSFIDPKLSTASQGNEEIVFCAQDSQQVRDLLEEYH